MNQHKEDLTYSKTREKLDDEIVKLHDAITSFQYASRLLKLMDQTDFPVYLAYANPDTGKLDYVNTRFANDLGYSKEEIISKPWADFVHPDDLEKTLSDYRAGLDSGKNFINYSNRYICKDGSILPIRWYTGKFSILRKELVICIMIREED